MPTLDTVKEDLNFLTDRISTQIRTIAIGLIIITWGLLIGDIKLNIEILDTQKYQLLTICAIAVIVMFLDFLQYMFGYFYTSSLRKKMIDKNLAQSEVDERNILWFFRCFFFHVKQYLLVIDVIWFIKITAILVYKK